MEICKFCQENPADKKNTHYLTDAIIRSSLNENGSNVREKGVMFNISTSRNDIEFRFQRATSQKAITEILGREPLESEIENALSVPFSVDYVFCSKCEDRFTAIEKQFLDNIIPKLRGRDFTGISEIVFEEVLEIRAFFLLQVYRMGISDPSLKISHEFLAHLRQVLLDVEHHSPELMAIPLNVTYLSTTGGDVEYTHNKVGIITEDGLDAIAMNDFVIQFPADGQNIPFVSLFGINNAETIGHFTNINEARFQFKVFDDAGRKGINANMTQLKVNQMLSNYKERFIQEYQKKNGRNPSLLAFQNFITNLLFGKQFNDSPKYSEEHFQRVMEYVLSKKY